MYKTESVWIENIRLKYPTMNPLLQKVLFYPELKVNTTCFNSNYMQLNITPLNFLLKF